MSGTLYFAGVPASEWDGTHYEGIATALLNNSLPWAGVVYGTAADDVPPVTIDGAAINGIDPYVEFWVISIWSDGTNDSPSDGTVVRSATTYRTLAANTVAPGIQAGSNIYWAAVPTSQWDGITYVGLEADIINGNAAWLLASYGYGPLDSEAVEFSAIAGSLNSPGPCYIATVWSNGTEESNVSISDAISLDPPGIFDLGIFDTGIFDTRELSNAISIANLVSSTVVDLTTLLENNYLDPADLSSPTSLDLVSLLENNYLDLIGLSSHTSIDLVTLLQNSYLTLESLVNSISLDLVSLLENNYLDLIGLSNNTSLDTAALLENSYLTLESLVNSISIELLELLQNNSLDTTDLTSAASVDIVTLLQNSYLNLANLATFSHLEHINTERFKWVVYPSVQANPLAEEIRNQAIPNGIYGEASVPELSGVINSGDFGNLDSGTLYKVAVTWTNGVNYSNVLVSDEFQTLSSGIIVASLLTRSLIEASQLAQHFIASVAPVSSSTSVEIAEVVEKAVVGTVQKLAIVSRLENTGLTSAGTISTENISNKITVDIITLVQSHLVSVLSVAQPSTLQNTTLIQSSVLSAANLLSQNLIDSTQVEEFLGVAVSGLFNASSIESVEILQRNIVALSNLSTTQILKEASLLNIPRLSPASSSQQSLLEGVTQLIQRNVVNVSKIINPVSLFSTAIATSGVLAPLALRSQTLLESPELIEKALLATVADLVNPNRLGNIELTQANTVVITDLFNQSSLESVGNLRQAYSILFDSLTHGSFLENAPIGEANYLNIENLSSPNLLEESVLTEINIIVPASLLSSLEITGVDLTQHHILSIDSISTAHLLAFLRLGGLAVGRLEGRLVLLSVFEGRLVLPQVFEGGLRIN